MVLDEADQLLLDRAFRLKAKFCVGLTATPFTNLTGVEGNHLTDFQQFKVYDSGIPSTVDQAEVERVDSVGQFFQKSVDRAKLVYGHDKFYEEVFQAHSAQEGYPDRFHLNEASLKKLRKLTKADTLFVS